MLDDEATKAAFTAALAHAANELLPTPEDPSEIPVRGANFASCSDDRLPIKGLIS